MKQRMRRISALLLVALMCVSCVVPAFAAESEGCPAVHTKSNCECTQIGEPHEAACGVQGYTTYQCNACKAYFADDFVESAGSHAWQTVRQAPTCTEDGVNKDVCLNCGEERVYSAGKATGHTPVFKNDNDCADGVICGVCGVDIKEIGDDMHTWGEPELTGKPTHVTTADGELEDKNGLAKFTCEFCGATKEVAVIYEGEHVWKIDLMKHPSCEEAGYYGGATCVICGKKVHLEKDANCPAADCTIEGCDHTVAEKDTCKYFTCTVKGCTHYKAAFDHCDPATCEHTTCPDTICHKKADSCAEDCVHVQAPYQEIGIIECKPSVEWVVVLPTCTETGSAYKACTMCKKAIGTPVTLDPLGHNYQTKIYKEVETGGLTAEQIALYEALAEKVPYVKDQSYSYSFYVEAEDGSLTLVPATAVLEDYVLATDEDLDLTVAPVSEDDEDEDENEVTYYVWTGKYKNVDPTEKDEAGNTYMHWGNNCSTETTSYRYACTVCGAEEAPVSFVGHYWVYDKNLSTPANCITGQDAIDVYVCANPNCDGLLEDRDEDNADAGIDYSVTTRTYDNVDNTTVAVKTITTEVVHAFAPVVVDPTCVSIGYTISKCSVEGCGAIDYTKAAEGYGKDDEYDEDGKPSSSMKGAYDIKEINPNAHKVEKETVIKASCTEKGKIHEYCCNDGCEFNPFDADGVDTGDKYLATNKEVAAIGHKKGELLKVDEEPATCERAQYEYYDCLNCDDELKYVKVAKKDHDYKLVTMTPDCTDQRGNNVLQCQNGCGDIKVNTTPETKFDATNPKHHSAVEIRSVVRGDCTTLDVVTYYCQNCKTSWEVEVDYVNEDGITLNGVLKKFYAGEGSGHKWKKVKVKAPTCVLDGHKEHYECSVCHALAADENGETLLKKEDVTIPKLSENGKHPMVTIITSQGEQEIYDPEKVYYTDAVEPTCTTKGHSAGAFCTVCDSWAEEEGEISELGHDFAPVTDDYASGVASCTTWGYQLEACERCNEQQIVGYVPMWTEDGEHKLVEDPEVPARVPTCDDIGYTAGLICSVCVEHYDATDPEEAKLIFKAGHDEIAKVPHVNKDGEEFYGICTDTVKDRVCVACQKGEFKYTYIDANGKKQTATLNATSAGQKFDCEFDGNHDHKATINYKPTPNNEPTTEILNAYNDNDEIVKGNDNAVLPERVYYPVEDALALAKGTHKWVVTYVAPTCMSYSYTLIVCEHCGYDFIIGEGTYSDEHTWDDWKTITPATYTAEGKKVRECKLCDATEEIVIPKLVGIEAEIELDNAVAEGEMLPDNGTVSLTITTNASDLKVWGVRIELTYTGKIEQNADGKDVISIVSLSDKFGENGLQVYHDAANKTITIVGTAPNTADGKLGEVTFNGEEELAQINLKLGKNSDGVSVEVNKFEITDKAQNHIVPMYDSYDSISVEVASGNVDGDYDIDINDAKALMMIVTGESEETYNSAADMNQDGEVTATDFAVITNKLLGKKA